MKTLYLFSELLFGLKHKFTDKPNLSYETESAFGSLFN